MLKSKSDIGYNPHVHLKCIINENNISVYKALRKYFSLSYEMIKKAKSQGKILLNSAIAYTIHECSEGDILEVILNETKHYPCRLLEESIDVVYEDDNILVINKPAPLPTVLGLNDTCNTLPNILISYFDNPKNFIYRPLNRLDSGTSGLMIIAKNAYIQSYLQNQLHTDNYIRKYIALSKKASLNETGTINLPIKRLTVNTWGIHKDGKNAITNYKVINENDKYSLIELQLMTGRTHQIRLHLSYYKSPIIGDYVYGEKHILLKDRFALHSHIIEVKLPYTKDKMLFKSDLPKIFYDIYNS